MLCVSHPDSTASTVDHQATPTCTRHQTDLKNILNVLLSFAAPLRLPERPQHG